MDEDGIVYYERFVIPQLQATADRYRNLALHLNERRWRNVKLRAETQATADRRLELLRRVSDYLKWLDESDIDDDSYEIEKLEFDISKELDDTALEDRDG